MAGHQGWVGPDYEEPKSFVCMMDHPSYIHSFDVIDMNKTLLDTKNSAFILIAWCCCSIPLCDAIIDALENKGRGKKVEN